MRAAALQELGGARLILCTAPSSGAIAALVAGLARGGQMIVVSFSNEPMAIPPALLMRGQ